MNTGGEHDALWDLGNLAGARRLNNWMFEQFEPRLGPRVAEIGAGIGTFSERLLTAGTERLALIEPEAACAEVLERRFCHERRVTVARETLPHAPALLDEPGGFDLVLCQNVLEHIEDQHEAVAAMAAALKPGGWLTILVPAHPRLYGDLDRRFGHYRRYTSPLLAGVVESAGLELAELHPFNLLGIPGWWVSNRRRSPSIGPGALAAYEAMVPLWRPIERRTRLPWGLSLVAHGRRPA